MNLIITALLFNFLTSQVLLHKLPQAVLMLYFIVIGIQFPKDVMLYIYLFLKGKGKDKDKNKVKYY